MWPNRYVVKVFVNKGEQKYVLQFDPRVATHLQAKKSSKTHLFVHFWSLRFWAQVVKRFIDQE